MSDLSLLAVLLGISFLVTVMVVAGIGFWLFGGQRVVERRLREAGGLQQPDGAGDSIQGAFKLHIDKHSRALVAPAVGWRESRIRSRLVQSGLRANSALTVTLLAKVLLAIGLPSILLLPLAALGIFAGQMALMVIWMVVLALLGFMLPDIWLSLRARERRHELEAVFPDTLDLLVVCIEAGLSLDAAIQRVGQEMARSSEAMSDELLLMSLEMRAGKARNEAMRALAERTGIADLNSLVSILIQAENFGTSVGEALREHAREMRLIRIQRAREKAAKLPVKLTFPILLFIFPALFLVILGPALINILSGLRGAFGG
jgi:tight adherence protein C